MATRGGQPGNKNATKSKTWAEALRIELATYADKQRDVQQGQALRKIARKVVEGALEGDKDAWKEIGDRLDGKPTQAITGPDDGPLQVDATVTFVKAEG